MTHRKNSVASGPPRRPVRGSRRPELSRCVWAESNGCTGFEDLTPFFAAVPLKDAYRRLYSPVLW